MRFRILSIATTLLIASSLAGAQATSARTLLDKPADWYASDEARTIAATILSYQTDLGGWPKNVDTAKQPYAGDRQKLSPTYDNSATTDELRYLARMYDATRDEQYKQAFMKGLDYVLIAQYPNGGWPQSYPIPKNYSRYITFNDGAMTRLMFFIKEVVTDPRYAFVDDEHRQRCRAAFDKGIDCILRCQIKVNGKLTAWCAQHDEKDFSPRPARAFELTSLSGAESVGIVQVLMRVEQPSPDVTGAVDAAVAWFDEVKLPGIKTEDHKVEGAPRGFDRVVVKDPQAPPMWARFYEIGTNKPIFCDRDGVAKSELSEIGIERRTGYRWLSYWPRDLLEKEYPAWKAKVGGTTPARH